MKKYVVFMLAAVAFLMSFSLSVNADISAGGGKGISLEFESLVRNNPSSGANVLLSEVSDDSFGTVWQYDYDGTLTNTNLQFSLQFANTETAPSGSYYYISFYYRFLETDGCVLPNSFVRRPNVNSNSGQTSLGTPSGEWKKISFVTSSAAEITSTAKVTMRLIPFITAGSKIRAQIADPVCMYYGTVTAEGELAPEQVIEAELGKSSIEKVYVDGAAIDTAQSPEGYFTEVIWEGGEMPAVTADTYIEGLYDVSCDSHVLPAQYTVTAYGLDYDRITGEGSKSEYKVTVDYKKAAAAPDVNDLIVDADYKVSEGDIINVNYQLYNPYGEAKECIIVLAFCDGNMFKEIITRKKTYEAGTTDDIYSYIADSGCEGCSVSVYIIDPETMTVIN